MYGDPPLGYFITWCAYGTRLPGDERGWIEYRHGWKMPDPLRELEAYALMTENACILSLAQRHVVEKQIEETCKFRAWVLHAVNCRSNHCHAVVSATVPDPKKIRVDLKAWATRALKERCDPTRDNWWAERGSIRYLNDDEALQDAIWYVQDGQDFPRK